MSQALHPSACLGKIWSVLTLFYELLGMNTGCQGRGQWLLLNHLWVRGCPAPKGCTAFPGGEPILLWVSRQWIQLQHNSAIHLFPAGKGKKKGIYVYLEPAFKGPEIISKFRSKSHKHFAIWLTWLAWSNTCRLSLRFLVKKSYTCAKVFAESVPWS